MQVELTGLLGAYFFDDDPRGNGLLVIYAAEVTGGTLRTDGESYTARYFERAELPEQIAGGGHNQVVTDWKAGKLKIDG